MRTCDARFCDREIKENTPAREMPSGDLDTDDYLVCSDCFREFRLLRKPAEAGR